MSSATKTTRCYIEEYDNGAGRLNARLREKGTGRKIDLGFDGIAAKTDFLRFLSAAKQNEATIPDVFSRDGDDDCVIVSGEVDFDAPDEIRFFSNDSLSYYFG